LTTKSVLTAAAGLALGTFALGQAPQQQEPAVNPAPAASELADVLTRHVSENLRVKAVVGKPVTAGSVTLVPILMIDVNFGGAGLVSPGGPPNAAPKAAAPQAPLAGADGFLMSGEARPLGFVVVTRQGTRFMSVAQPSAK
jgi:uncharacterized spore protein YtfJ